MLHCLKKIALPMILLAVAPVIYGQSVPTSTRSSQVATDAVLTSTITEKTLSLHYEIQAAETAINACAANHVRATVVITDNRGNVKLQMVGDGANGSLLEDAHRKARTAALMRQSTTALQKALGANPKLRIPPDPDFLLQPGGVPIRAGSEIVGSIGVAGGIPGTADTLDQCAQAGVDALKDTLHPVPSSAQSAAPPK